MLTHCPHCQKEINLSVPQKSKIRQALSGLPEGKTLKISCPNCREGIHLNREEIPVEAAPGAPKPERPQASGTAPAPPSPPDIAWLREDGAQPDLEEVVKDVPLALVLVRDEQLRRQVGEALQILGYQPEFPASGAAAEKRMRFVNFSAVVLHSDFEEGGLADSAFHRHMRKLPMGVRRMLLYVLIGPDFHTLYDLQALTWSANLVVNQRDAGKMPLVLKKAFHDYQLLFGPYIAALREHGKL
ncbi:hypothetical protein ACHHRT_09465 [Desulfurivibrio sp. D14AmB]|uniref:hypothetical protein n=1 Tax=Desulfurivibrio sp. D14AmB TaxID=3374370 RepID=UPI00376EBB40